MSADASSAGRATQIAVVVIVAFLAYSRVSHAPFVFDDVTFTGDPTVHAKSVADVWKLVCERGGNRSVGYASFAINYLLGGGSPTAIRCTNVAIHIVTTLLVWRSLLLIGRLRMNSSERERISEAGRILVASAFWCALIWEVHPLWVHCVTYAVQRLTSLSGLFVVAAGTCWFESRTRKSNRTAWIVCGSLLLILAINTKQIGIIGPLQIAIADAYARPGAWGRFRTRNAVAGVAGLAVLVITGCHYFRVNAGALQSGFVERGITVQQRLLSETRVLWYYLSVILVPMPSRFSLDHDFEVSRSVLSPMSTLPAMCGWAVAIACVILLRKRLPGAIITAAWFFAGLIIESSVVPLDLAYEHRLYLPSLAVVVASVVAVIRGAERFRAAAPACAAIAVLLVGETLLRNEVWRNPIALWEHDVARAPGKARVVGNLGKALMDAGRMPEAKAQFEKAICLNPHLTNAYVDLAAIYIDHYRDYSAASQILNRAIEMCPRDPGVLVNIGVIDMSRGAWAEAESKFLDALAIDRSSRVAMLNMAACAINKRDQRKAEAWLSAAEECWGKSRETMKLRDCLALLKESTEVGLIGRDAVVRDDENGLSSK